MRADALGEPVVQRADLQRGLHLLERVLVDLQLLVGAHDRGGADPRRWLSGAQDVDPVQQRLLVDLGLVALVTERAVLDVEGEVFGHLALVDHAPGALADLPALALRSLPRSPSTICLTFSRSRSVSVSSSSRLRARSAATAGLRHTTSRSPGNSGTRSRTTLARQTARAESPARRSASGSVERATR